MLFLAEAFLIMLFVGMTTKVLTASAPVDDKSAAGGESKSFRWRRETSTVMEFLSKYGYLKTNPDGSLGHFLSDEVVTGAIKKFQEFTGLRVTGILDKATLKKMKSPRCGVPDIINSDSSTNRENIPYQYFTMGTRWSKTRLTWKPTQLSAKLNESDQLSAIQKALDLWAEVAPLKFKYSTHEPDIEIKFASGEHGDTYQTSFDGKGGVLAHAYGPGSGVGGDVHFDEDEAWTIGNETGADLTTVAAHEFGHTLGLGHSSAHGAVMAPYYTYSDNLSLHKDDILGIQAIYGRKHRRPSPRVSIKPVTLPAATTTNTTASTTANATSKSKNMRTPFYCDVNFRDWMQQYLKVPMVFCTLFLMM